MLCVLVLLEYTIGVVIMLRMEDIFVVPEDETVSVGAEPHRGAEVVKLGLFLISYLRELSFSSHSLGLDG